MLSEMRYFSISWDFKYFTWEQIFRCVRIKIINASSKYLFGLVKLILIYKFKPMDIKINDLG